MLSSGKLRMRVLIYSGKSVKSDQKCRKCRKVSEMTKSLTFDDLKAHRTYPGKQLSAVFCTFLPFLQKAAI